MDFCFRSMRVFKWFHWYPVIVTTVTTGCLLIIRFQSIHSLLNLMIHIQTISKVYKYVEHHYSDSNNEVACWGFLRGTTLSIRSQNFYCCLVVMWGCSFVSQVRGEGAWAATVAQEEAKAGQSGVPMWTAGRRFTPTVTRASVPPTRETVSVCATGTRTFMTGN